MHFDQTDSVSDNSLPCENAVARNGTGLLCAKKLTLLEAAKKMGLGETTMRRIVRRGEIPCLKYGTKQLFFEHDLEVFMQAHYGRMAQPERPSTRAHAAPPDYLKNSPHLHRQNGKAV